MERTLSTSQEQTKNLAFSLAKNLRTPQIICLWGDLGSGKTTFAKGFASALGLDEKKLKSPTYSLIRKYRIDSKILHHCDFYRLEHPDEILVRDLDEMFAEENAIILIEWPERIKNLLPEKRIDIYFEYQDPDTRQITIQKQTS